MDASWGSLTNFVKFSTMIDVCLCTFWLLSFNARAKRGTITAKAGPVTSATKVVADRRLMHSGTVSGARIASTRDAKWGRISLLSITPHTFVVVLTACLATSAFVSDILFLR